MKICILSTESGGGLQSTGFWEMHKGAIPVHQREHPPGIIIIINNINQIYLKRNTNNHMISKNKHKFQVAVEEDRKTQPELARTEW